MDELERWLKANNYILTQKPNGAMVFTIDASDRARVFRFLESNDRIEDWSYKGNYSQIEVTINCAY